MGGDGVVQMACAGAAEKADFVSCLAQGLGEGEAAHDVAAADLEGRVCTDEEFHVLQLSGYLKISSRFLLSIQTASPTFPLAAARRFWHDSDRGYF